jgi:two-component sensor histidine kinase
VPFSVAMPLGLITPELFSNSLKYAHPEFGDAVYPIPQ